MSKIESDETSSKMKRKQYEKDLRKLQTELCCLQEWVKLKGQTIHERGISRQRAPP